MPLIGRIIGAAALFLGLLLGAIGLSWTAGSGGTTVASMPAPETPLVVVQPGVLGLLDETVTVTAKAENRDLPVLLAFAPTSDVEAWLDDASYTSVTGLESWDTLETSVIDGRTQPLPNPAGADLWRDELTGTGEITVEITPDSGQVSLLAASDGTAPAPQLTLTWAAAATSPWLIPILILAGLLTLGGVGVLAYDIAHRRHDAALQRSREKSERLAAANVTETTTIPSLAAQPTEVVPPEAPPMIAPQERPATGLTRREIRERERALAEAAPPADADTRYHPDGPIAATAGMSGAGIVPGVPGADRIRASRFDGDSMLPPGAAPTRRGRRAAGILPDSLDSAGQRASAARDAAGPGHGAAIVPDALQADARGSEAELESAGSSIGAAVVPDSLKAAGERAAADREVAGAAHGAGIVPDAMQGLGDRAAAYRQAARGAAGAGIVPARVVDAGENAVPRHATQNEEAEPKGRWRTWWRRGKKEAE